MKVLQKHLCQEEMLPVLLRADRLSREIPPGISSRELLQVLTRHGIESAFLIGGSDCADVTVPAAAKGGKLLDPAHPLVSRLQNYLSRRPFEFRHYLICNRHPVAREQLFRHFHTELHSMLALPALFGGRPWQDAAFFPLSTDPLLRCVACFFANAVDWPVNAVFAGAIHFCVKGNKLTKLPEDPFAEMTDMQHKFATWAAKGKTAEDISIIENVSIATVRYNLAKIRRLLKLDTLDEAIIIYSRRFNISPM